MQTPLASEQLYHRCDPGLFAFTTTQELEELEQPIGQGSALESVEFGIEIAQEGYNLFAMGPSGSGKHSTLMSFLQKKAQGEALPNDWCYVNNFKDPRLPVAIELPPGKAVVFRHDMAELIELLKAILPAVFESSDYQEERERINQKYLEAEGEIFHHLQEEAQAHDVAMSTSSSSRITFVPVVDGKILSAQEFKDIEGEKKEEMTRKMGEFEAIVKEGLRKVGELNKARHKEFKALERKVTKEAVASVIEETSRKYAGVRKIVEYLNGLQNDVVNHVQDFLAKPEETGMPPFMQEFYTPSFTRYMVNLFIEHDGDKGAPVIYEDNPSHQNLIGRIEYLSQVGTLVTDFSMIKPGALHKANGGYLVLDARKLLMQPLAYEELKRVLRSREIRIESLAQQFSLISTTTLEPEPIPVDVKVVLIGERMLYYLLYHYDPDFRELFKVSADFEDDMPRNDENIQLYARMIGTIAKRSDLRHLTPGAVARVIEQSSKEVSHVGKFSTHLGRLADLLKEADYWSKKNDHNLIESRDVETALAAQIKRRNRIQLKLYEQIDEGTVMINLDGSAVGQINALSYVSLGGYHFGLPSRITARTRIGKGDIIDIERKVELSGPIHAKGVMILSAYLGSKYASDLPLSLSASLVFEQSYGKVEGDSASSTELYALLSSLSDLPIRQNFAVTGSVNQFGEIQPIGGVNEKIEGFFDVCMRHDAAATYGVVIPQSNVKHLMLKPELLAAVDEGRFTIYAVSTIDEGIAILTGVEAGSADAKGNYPKNSVNARVVARLKALSETVRAYNHPKPAGKKLPSAGKKSVK